MMSLVAKRTTAAAALSLLFLSVLFAEGKQDGSKTQSGAGIKTGAWAPRKDFTIRVPFAAGGAFDTATRIVGQGLQKTYKKSAIVKNITGANGAVAAADLASVAPDATDLMGGGIAMFTLTPLFDSKISMKLEDYRIISGMLSEDFILCVNSAKSGIKSWQDLVEYSKKNRIIAATNPPGGTTHMLATALYGGAGIKFDAITDNGGNKNMLTLLAGESLCAIVTTSVAAQHIGAGGTIVPIAVFSEQPYKGFSGYTVPTVKSLGFDIVFRSSNFLMARAGVSAENAGALYKTIAGYFASEECKALASKANIVFDEADGESVRKDILAAAELCKKVYEAYYAPKK